MISPLSSVMLSLSNLFDNNKSASTLSHDFPFQALGGKACLGDHW